MKRFWRQYRTLLFISLPFVTSILLFLSFIHYSMSWLVFVALVPYLFFLSNEKAKAKPRIILATWLMGLFTMLLVDGWLVAADTQGWLQINGPVLQISIFAIWLVMGLILSVGFLVVGWLGQYFLTRVTFWHLSVWLLPVLWALGEWSRSWVMSVAAYGPGASIGANWNFGALGLAASATPVGYLSRGLGLYGLSMVVVFINTLAFWAWQRRYRFVLISVAVLCGLTFAAYRSGGGKSRSVKIGTVQLASADNDYYDPLTTTIKTGPTFRGGPVQYLVLPEYSYFFDNGTEAQHRAVTTAAFRGRVGTLIYTRKGPVRDDRPTNETIVATATDQIISRQEKSFLIPTGEYLPWAVSATLQASGQRPVVDYFNQAIAVAKSPLPEYPVRVRNETLGILACSGVITPAHYQRLTNQGATLLINSASLNQFRNAKWYHEQARQFARFEAIANNRPFIQSARGGFSFIIDHDGNFLVDFRQPGLRAGAATVHTGAPHTPYTILGEWTLITGTIGIAAVGLRLRPH